MNRRDFVRGTLAGVCLAGKVFAGNGRRPKVVLRSSWQAVNIGDIAHTPGVITQLERNLPDVEVVLWPMSMNDAVEAMERKRFPKLKILRGKIHMPEIRREIEQCDFLLHGSGPSLVATRDFQKIWDEMQKPFGVFGITWNEQTPEAVALLSKAKFVFFRDSVSLECAKVRGVQSPVMEFGPDGAFSVDLRNEAMAGEFMAKNGLEPGKFACVIPRYRKTPYWKIHGKPMTPKDEAYWKYSHSMLEHDHAPVRDAIVRVVRELGLKVLICPEDVSQVELGGEIFYNKLPDDVRKKCVWRDTYWLTDEALSVYTKSVGLFGLEMHSPIMCIGNGIPAIVCRFAQQTSKGFMWRDIGLSDWLFDLDVESDLPKIGPAVFEMLTNREKSREKVAAAQEVVRQRQKRMTDVLWATLEGKTP
ncbi:MAG: polysaccharide pyruvyl transferase family protein [Planctomycetia bacterium]|nr:polysaccharide pyruvyl transferase family protein [Planctomycetia bacterium]